MSTRCQVKVTDGEKSITLYHHSDGYCEHILDDIRKALSCMMGNDDTKWRSGRAGYVASHLCHVHPAGFQPEEGHDLHGDIEFYYVLHVNPKDNPQSWEIEVFQPNDAFWNKRTKKNMDVLHARQSVESVLLQYSGKMVPA
jgi:hypothetical protein